MYLYTNRIQLSEKKQFVCHNRAFITAVFIPLPHQCSQPFEEWKVMDWGTAFYSALHCCIVGNRRTCRANSLCFNQHAFYHRTVMK